LFKKLIYTLIGLVVLLLLLVVGAILYAKPDQALNWRFEEVSVVDKAVDMIKNRKLVVQLTEQDINNLVKKHLSTHTVLPHQLELTGAQFHLQGNRLEADVNLLWQSRVPAAATLLFQLNWNSPNLEIQHIGTRIKHADIPLAWFQLDPIQIPVGNNLPKHIGIKDVNFDSAAIRIGLRLK
jgi:hypothetical protein